MRVLVCGSRDLTDERLMFDVLDSLSPRPVLIIHGAYRGADTLAGKWARKNGIASAAYPADWNRGKNAGPERNARMIREGRPDLVIAFPLKGAKNIGTNNCVLQAEAAGIKVRRIEG
jgi:hypothetical protein